MQIIPYVLSEPLKALSPFVIDTPHSGRTYPADFAYACPLPLLRQAEDSFVDEIVSDALEIGASILKAEFPRSMIDVNRAPNDIDPATIDGVWPGPLEPDEMTLSGYGLVRRLCRNGIPVYSSPLSVTEIQRRLHSYYLPYHDCLKKLVEGRLKKFGVCYFFDMHSMPDRIEGGAPRADIILGDREGMSCAPSLTRYAQKVFQDLGYRVTLNVPYKGREIVKRYGLEGLGAQALQIEINRRLYMDEVAIKKHQGIEALKKDMGDFFRTISRHLLADSDKLAAE